MGKNDRRNELRRRAYAEMTPEQKTASLESRGLSKDKLAEIARNRRALRTPEQKEVDSIKAHNRYRGIYIKETEEDRKKRKQSNARFEALHPERRKEIKRKNRLKYTYGLTPEKYDELLSSQGYCCACCGSNNPGSKRGWHIDHCHVAGTVRGILCQYCNLMIGHAMDQPERMLKGAAYLKLHKGGE